MKAPPSFVQKLKIDGHRHYVFVLFPLPANREIAQDLAGYIGFQWLLDDGAEAILRTAKFGGSRCYIKEAKGFQVAEEPLVGGEMRDKTPQVPRSRIDETKGDHRRATCDWWSEKERELIDEIAD